MPSTEGRPMSRKRKNDSSKTLEEWTKKQCETPRASKLDIVKTGNNLCVR
jgi:hypothetical protein